MGGAPCLPSGAIECGREGALQSIALVSELSAEDIVVADREDNQSVFKRLLEQDPGEWIRLTQRESQHSSDQEAFANF